MDILGPDRGKMVKYGSDFQQVNLTPNGRVSPTVYINTGIVISPFKRLWLPSNNLRGAGVNIFKDNMSPVMRKNFL